MTKLPSLPRVRSHIMERRIHKALESQREKQARNRDFIRLSSIGKCVRELWAIQNGHQDERPPKGQALMTFDTGHFLEPMVIHHLRLAGYEVEAGQRELMMGNRLGIGHIDGVIRWPGEDWSLLEVKTAKAKKFTELLESDGYADWNPGYGDQVQAYMGASQGGELPLNGCEVVVICKDDQRIYNERIRFDTAEYSGLMKKARTAKASELPARPPLMKSQYCKACKWCGVNEWCWSAVAGVTFDTP